MTEPLVPADVDLSDLPWMPLEVSRLLDSDLFATSTGDQFKAAVSLWAKSWHQQPAGSLPNNDKVLAHLSGSGSKWPKVREMALRNWLLCDDGRMYHPVIAPHAIRAWKEKLRSQQKRQGDRDRLNNWRSENRKAGKLAKTGGLRVPRGTETPADAGTETELKRVSGNGRNGTETDRTGIGTIKDIPTTSGADAPDPIFGFGLDLLKRKAVGDKAARSFLGMMRKEVGDKVAFELLERCDREDITDPIPWLSKALVGRKSSGRGMVPAGQKDYRAGVGPNGSF